MAGWPATPSVTSLDLNAGGLVLPAPWIKVENLLDLELPTTEKGENLSVAGVAGRRSRRHLYDESEWDLRCIIRGDVLHNGGSPASTRAGRVENLRHLREQTAPTSAEPWTRPAAFTMEDSSVWTGDVQTFVLTSDLSLTWGRVVLTVRLPAGFWTPA